MEKEYRKLEAQLRQNYLDFFEFSLSLLVEMDNETNKNSKFIVINLQVSLELFLKYFFLNRRKTELIFKPNKSSLIFKDFNLIIDAFYKKEIDLLVHDKKTLKEILNLRNKLVHEGEFDNKKDQTETIFKIILFMQSVSVREYSEPLLRDYSKRITSNKDWVQTSQKFAQELAKINNTDIYECWFCWNQSFITKTLFNNDDYPDEGFQCVTCLESFVLEDQIGLAKCPDCEKEAFVYDCLNLQKDNSYVGRCMSCDFEYHIYECNNCQIRGIDIDDNIFIFNNNLPYCSQECLEERNINLI